MFAPFEDTLLRHALHDMTGYDLSNSILSPTVWGATVPHSELGAFCQRHALFCAKI